MYGSGSRSSGACSSVWHRISRVPVSTDHGDVAAHLVAVDGRLVVHEVRRDLLARHRGPDARGHHLRVVAGLLDRHDEVVGAIAGGHGGHALSLSRRVVSRASVSPGGALRRRTNRSERGSATGSTRPAACSTRHPSAVACTSIRSSWLTCGRSILSWATRRDQVLDRGDVDRLAAAVAEQQRRRLDGAHRLGGLERADRRDPVDPVADQLGQRARRRRSGRPARRAGPRARRRDTGTPGCGRALHDEARRRRPRATSSPQRLPGAAHLLGVVDVAPHVGQVGALAQALGGRLEHDVPAELARRPRSPPRARRRAPAPTASMP